jgi:hypothetical protein
VPSSDRPRRVAVTSTRSCAILPGVTTVVLAWGAVGCVCVGAVVFGQTARSAPGRRRRSPARRLGLLLSLSGPWLVVVAAMAGGALTGAWLSAAAAGAAGVVVVALAGLALTPR